MKSHCATVCVCVCGSLGDFRPGSPVSCSEASQQYTDDLLGCKHIAVCLTCCYWAAPSGCMLTGSGQGRHYLDLKSKKTKEMRDHRHGIVHSNTGCYTDWTIMWLFYSKFVNFLWYKKQNTAIKPPPPLKKQMQIWSDEMRLAYLKTVTDTRQATYRPISGSSLMMSQFKSTVNILSFLTK